MDPQFDPVHWCQSFFDDPLAALIQAFHVLLRHGVLDVSALWRQFYDESLPDFLRWDSLLIYVTGCALAYLAVRRRQEASVRQFLGYLLPREIWSSRSFRIDIQFYIATLLRVPQLIRIGGIVLVAAVVPRLAALHLDQLPGLDTIATALASLPTEWQLLLQGLIVVVASDFAFYWGHRLLHRSQILWQFHKVHHYSRQLNMLTGHRQHPVDLLVTETLGNLCAALALCLFFDYSGQRGSPSAGAPYWLAFGITTINLVLTRFTHSHVPFSLGRGLDRILVTPAVHIVHHSRDISDVNFGGWFSVWDVFFGTYHAHDASRQVRSGIAEFEDDYYRGLIHALFEPFKDAFSLVIPKRRSVWVHDRPSD